LDLATVIGEPAVTAARKLTVDDAGNRNTSNDKVMCSLQIFQHNTLEQYELSCKERGLEITKLQLQKIRLEALVNDYQNNNEGYIKITRAVEEKLFGVLPNAKVLLRYALLSITESIRNNPERFVTFLQYPFHNRLLRHQWPGLRCLLYVWRTNTTTITAVSITEY